MNILRQVISATLLSILLLFVPRLGFGAEFRSLIKDPKAYDRKRVILEGVVIGNGPEFELFENSADAKKIASASKSLYLTSKDASNPQVGAYNLRRVRVTGIIDATLHGTWGNPCGMLLERIEALSAPVSAPLIPVAVFRNEENRLVVVHLVGGNPEGQFSIPSKAAVESPISNGQRVVVTSDKGPIMAEGTLRIRKGSPYFDRQTGYFFYRIRDRNVEAVLPASARNWNWRH